METTTKQSNFFKIFFVAITCILSGGLIGAITNMINGIVSPYYFKAIMQWKFPDIWTASIAQGMFEGLIYGVIFSLIFTTGFGLITKGEASYIFALRQILKIICVVFVCWLIGGFMGIFLALLSPDFFMAHIPIAPSDKTEMLRFAWVGGSINGGMIGGLLSAVLGIVVTKNSWNSSVS